MQRVAVIGLGYVGLPLAVAFGKKFPTVGFDLDQDKIASYARHIDPAGDVEPCPFAPFSDSNVRGRPLVEALQSPFFEKLREDPEFAREAGGGCVLWKKREEVEALLDRSRQAQNS